MGEWRWCEIEVVSSVSVSQVSLTNEAAVLVLCAKRSGRSPQWTNRVTAKREWAWLQGGGLVIGGNNVRATLQRQLARCAVRLV